MATNYGIFNRDNAGEHAKAPLSLTVSGAGSPKGSLKEEAQGGHCLCSPTTHPGSFRCRFHRSGSMGWRMRRSNSMPADKPVGASSTSAGEGISITQNPVGNTA